MAGQDEDISSGAMWVGFSRFSTDDMPKSPVTYISSPLIPPQACLPFAAIGAREGRVKSLRGSNRETLVSDFLFREIFVSN